MSPILSEQDIHRFREEIKNIYGFYDPKVHAHLFSMRVHRHLDEKLSEIVPGEAVAVKEKLIRDTLAQGKLTITSDDLIAPPAPVEAPPIPADAKGAPAYRQLLVVFACIVVLFGLHFKRIEPAPADTAAPAPMPIDVYPVTNILSSTAYYPYVPIDHSGLKHYIKNERFGRIGTDDAYYKIVFLAKQNDIDPLLLFAIIGQEQNFVPLDHPSSGAILNNPFNVYYSWEAFNTNLSESTQIAINTIQYRMAQYTGEGDPLIWLNAVYAEDPNWHLGVRYFYTFFQKTYRL